MWSECSVGGRILLRWDNPIVIMALASWWRFDWLKSLWGISVVVGSLKRQHLFSKTGSYYTFVFIIHYVSPRVPTNLQFSLLHTFHKGDNPRVPVLFGKEPYHLGKRHKNATKQHLRQLCMLIPMMFCRSYCHLSFHLVKSSLKKWILCTKKYCCSSYIVIHVTR